MYTNVRLAQSFVWQVIHSGSKVTNSRGLFCASTYAPKPIIEVDVRELTDNLANNY